MHILQTLHGGALEPNLSELPRRIGATSRQKSGTTGIIAKEHEFLAVRCRDRARFTQVLPQGDYFVRYREMNTGWDTRGCAHSTKTGPKSSMSSIRPAVGADNSRRSNHTVVLVYADTNSPNRGGWLRFEIIDSGSNIPATHIPAPVAVYD